MQHILRLVQKVGTGRLPVLLLGETGTGKECVARAIHNVKGGGSFVTIDCPSLVGPLTESELFGHVRGAFTGAVGKNHVIEVKGVSRGGGPPDDADPADPAVSTYYAEKQSKLVDAFKACGFDFAASLYHGNLPGHTCKALEFHNMDWITSGAIRFLHRHPAPCLPGQGQASVWPPASRHAEYPC